ncbi:MAG: hypothetical protein WCD21_42700, partial [Streptomyces sp.]
MLTRLFTSFPHGRLRSIGLIAFALAAVVAALLPLTGGSPVVAAAGSGAAGAPDPRHPMAAPHEP